MNEPALIDSLLSDSHTIAVVGYSAKPDRPSNSVSRTLRAHGFRVVPVNPQLRGTTIEGERSYDRLSEIPKDLHVDFVDVFRRGEFLDAVVDDAIAAGIRALWFQLSLGNEAAAQRAEAAGLRVVWDRCTAIELRRRVRARP
ncbi:MAG: CoA-binding protein [Chloroflexi bacterium]|nr:MAG: CoA-binding protein [Chloroflexota bacterium]TMG68836.1 MAG: CoA-binding protein [Chloroflexota bacterium]